MKVKVKLTQTELVEITLWTVLEPRKNFILNQFFLTQLEAYSLLGKLDRALLDLALKQKRQRERKQRK